ncbi:MAG TPA: M81 family metallopeptidase [Thermomicrobiales bacterium]|nr:M81 family metallopeptidase [Thermomicrobiales bacterium]
MVLRIALAGFAHETNTFASKHTGLDEFVAAGLFRGEEVFGLAGTNTVVGGVVDRAASVPDVELVPLLATSAIPGGLVTAEAVETIEGEIQDGLRRTRPDAVILDLHGAMATELADDGEGTTIRRVRETMGAGTPIVVVLDLHANLSQEMVDLADAVLVYNTYPHVDMAERGAEAVDLAIRIAEGTVRPVSALAKLPLIPPLPRQYSHVEPTRSIMERAYAFERLPLVVNVGIAFAFPYADCPYPGMGVVVTTDGDRDLAVRLAEEMKTFIWERREEFRPDVASVEQAVHEAMAEPVGPVVLADLGDNPGGGSACDGTALLWALLDLGASGAAFAVIADREAVDAAFAAGTGARLELSLGGKTDDLHGFPIPVTATVRSLSDGRFVHEGPVDTGRAETLGRTAVLVCDGRHGNTVEVIVCERRVQPLDAAVFRSQGIEPMARKILVVKSSVHFRGSFTPLASRIIEVDTPGLTGVDFTRFPYRRLPRPIWPLDPI